MKYIKYLIIIVLICIPLFQHLDDRPLRIWDESRLAENAYEMNKDGNLLVTHINGGPEMWNSKPPIMIWMQVVCFKFFGVNDLATRLPAAICAMFICILMLVFCAKYLDEPWLGIIAVLIYVTSEGVVSDHASRTGDYDVPLSFFTLSYCLAFYIYIETKKIKYLYITFAGLILAVLTKSIAGLFFVPALFIYALYTKEILNLLKNKHTYFGLILLVLFVGGYYSGRELVNPGYLKAVMENELGGRYLSTNEGHKEDVLFYYNGFVNTRFKFWIMYFPCSALLLFAIRNEKIKKFGIFCFLLTIIFFIIITSASSKLQHYDEPIYSFLALVTAIFFLVIFKIIQKQEIKFGLTKFNVLPYAFLFLIFIAPYRLIINLTYLPRDEGWEKDFYAPGYLWKNALRGKIDLNGFNYLPSGYNVQNDFYLNLLKDKGVKISQKDFKELKLGDKVIASIIEPKQYLESHYTFNVIKDIDNVRFYEITGIKIP